MKLKAHHFLDDFTEHTYVSQKPRRNQDMRGMPLLERDDRASPLRPGGGIVPVTQRAITGDVHNGQVKLLKLGEWPPGRD